MDCRVGDNGDRWMRLAVTVWAVVLLVICVRVLATPRTGSVYGVFAAGGQRWAAGDDLYRRAGGDYFRYSPLVAACLTPLGLLPERLGGVLWRLLNAAALLAAFAWWQRTNLPESLSRKQSALLGLLLLPLAIGSLNNGQANALVLGAMLASLAAVRSGRWLVAGCCAAFACLFKLYPLALALPLALLYPRRFAGRWLLGVAAGLALPFLLQRPDYVLAQYVEWWQHLQTYDRGVLALEEWYRDLRLLCQVCQVPLSPAAFLSIQLGAAAGIAATCVAARLLSWPERPLLRMLLGLASVWMTLLGPATESCTYVLVAPTLAWALLEAAREQQPFRARLALGASFALFVATQLANWFPGARTFHALGPHPLAGLLLAAYLLAGEPWRVWRRPWKREEPAVRVARAA